MWSLSVLIFTVCCFSVSALDKACPYKPVDLIFVLDGSGSEGINNFKKQTQFVANFINQFEIGPNATRVSLLSFGTAVYNEFFLNALNDNDTVIQRINNADYPNGETNTHLALRFVKYDTLSARHEGDRNVSKIVVVLTDGQSLEPDMTMQAAAALKGDPSVTVLAVGIGNHVDPKELLYIASDSNHTFRVSDFDDLDSIEADLTTTACNACNDLSDICFVLDSSGSEGAVNFHKQLEFINLIINEFSFDGEEHTKVCVVTFSTQANVEIDLNSYHAATALMENVLKIPYRDGETMTNLGITYAGLRLVNPSTRAYANKIMLVLTDGRSTEPVLTEHAAEVAHKKGIETYVVGIGRHVDKNELRTIASDNDHMFMVSNFDQLEAIHQSVVDGICAKKRPEIITSTTTTMPTFTPRPACGLKPADIVFVLDSSDSEGAENFQKEVEFVYNFASQFSIGTNNVQFSVVTFSSEVKNNFYFNDYNSRHDVLQAIANNVTYMGQGTNTSGALFFVREYSLAPQNGARANSTKFVIVITDGRSDNTTATLAAAQKLKAEATVISIGVGPAVDRQELANIASSHRVLTVDNFNLLKSIRNQLIDLACESHV